MHLRQEYSHSDRISPKKIQQAQENKEQVQHTDQFIKITSIREASLISALQIQSVSICSLIISRTSSVKRLYKTHNNISRTPEWLFLINPLMLYLLLDHTRIILTQKTTQDLVSIYYKLFDHHRVFQPQIYISSNQNTMSYITFFHQKTFSTTHI